MHIKSQIYTYQDSHIFISRFGYIYQDSHTFISRFGYVYHMYIPPSLIFKKIPGPRLVKLP